MKVSIDVSHADFQPKLALLARTDPALYNEFLRSLSLAVGMDWHTFCRDYRMSVHPSPHFFQNIAFGHFVPPQVSSPIEVYVEVETKNDMITGHITLIGFWKPRYLMP